MKKILLPLVVLVLSMAGCQKENEGILTLSMEQYTTDAKLHLNDDHYAVWDDGDKIWLNGNEATVDIDDASSTATLTAVSTAATYTAIYPYSWAGTNTINYPATQSCRATGIDAPMAAQSNGNSLTFRNLGSLLAVNVSGVTKVQKIEVIATGTTAINGTATIDFSGDRPELGTLTGGTSTTTLDCNGTTINDGESKTFYIAMPPVTDVRLTIKIYDDYYCYTRSQESSHDFEANHGYNVPFVASNDIREQYAPLNNQIWYTATSKMTGLSSTFLLNDHPLAATDGHLFSNGKGVLTFADDLTAIPNYAFENKDMVTSFTLPPSVTSVGSSAFKDCDNLTSMTMPSVVSTGYETFRDCDNLTTLTMPNMTSIGGYTFADCNNLVSIPLPASLTTIGEGAFRYCSNLVTIMLPEGVATIGTYAFSETGLTSAHLPASLTTIGQYAFTGSSLIDLYCYGETHFSQNAVNCGFTPLSTTLHVPQASNWESWWKDGYNLGAIEYDL